MAVCVQALFKTFIFIFPEAFLSELDNSIGIDSDVKEHFDVPIERTVLYSEGGNVGTKSTWIVCAG